MKKAKLLLTGMAVLAVVGGALAFKAKTAFTAKYCYSTTSGNCSLSNTAYKITDALSGTQYYYYSTTDVTPCQGTNPPHCSGDRSSDITTSTTFLVGD